MFGSLPRGHYWKVNIGSFVDDCSRHVWVATMSRKEEVLEVFNRWKKCVELQTGRKIKVLCFDNAGEKKYKEDPFQRVCLQEGIARHFDDEETIGRRNGMAKLMNCTLLKKVQYLMSNSGLEKTFWA